MPISSQALKLVRPLGTCDANIKEGSETILLWEYIGSPMEVQGILRDDDIVRSSWKHGAAK